MSLSNPEWYQQIISAARSAAGKKGAKIRLERIRSAELLPGQRGGRKSVKTHCDRCGELLPSARAAKSHCRRKQRRKDPIRLAFERMLQPKKPNGRPMVKTVCRFCRVGFPSKRMFREHECVGKV